MDLINKLVSSVSQPAAPEKYPLRPKSEIFQEHFNTTDFWEVSSRKRKVYSTRDHGLRLSELTKIQLPYEALDHPKLPSLEELEDAFGNNPLYRRHHSRQVCKIGDILVKVGPQKNLIQEAEDMIWLREHSKVNVAKVYAVKPRAVRGHLRFFLFLEYIEGEQFNADKWLTLNNTQRDAVVFRFCEQLKLLRAVPSEGYYGRVKDQGYDALAGLVATNGKGLCGPYKTHEDFVSAVFTATEFEIAFSTDEYKEEERKLLHELKDVLGNPIGSEPKLTHVELGMINWLVAPMDGETLQTASDYKVTFIDWNGLGWYPAWLQMAQIQFEIPYSLRIFNVTRDNKGVPVDVSYNDDEIPKYQATMEKFWEPPYPEQTAFYYRMRKVGMSCCPHFG